MRGSGDSASPRGFPLFWRSGSLPMSASSDQMSSLFIDLILEAAMFRHLATVLALVTFVLVVTPAQAQLSHTWVSSTGSDGGICDRPSPCQTFSGALGKTNAGGEITCVDSGNFGGVFVNKS